jgi:hydroxyethylthiazole kinase-like uncharacterized protein yjeF
MIGLDAEWLRRHPLPEPDNDADKNERGRIVVTGGSRFVPGALRLTGEAALRAGAGKLQLGTVAEAALMLGVLMPEAGVFGLGADSEGEIESSAAADILEHARSADALVLGPGMKGSAEMAELVRSVALGLPDQAALLLDAGAIAPCRSCAEAMRARGGPVVLTPHHGEMAALLGLEIDMVEKCAEAVARDAAEELQATVVLKGADTIIASAGEEPLHFAGGSVVLATGGSGDILAGVLGGLLARGAAPITAAAWSVWAHAAAGRRLAARHGGLGLLGRELLKHIPRALNRAD